ncbi:MAG: phosphate acyltransferase PlsX [Flavobacteriales bacterium]|nr:phosphate acyltransferase PlsX [Flavobacteriales bacterium]
MKLGIDMMGGDYAPGNTVAGALLALPHLSTDTILVLIGDQGKLEAELAKSDTPYDKQRIEIVHAPEVISMHDHPTKAFRSKPQSSISIGFHLLKEGMINGFAGAGNTGAMLVGAMHSVKAVPGVIRPCITSVLPRENGTVGIILDVGTNADCKPDVLYQFGILGSLYAKHVLNIDNPKVGLLNIGEEEEKGNLLSQSTHMLMKDTQDFNFIGNVEGRDIFDDKADVVVCDGFTGNVVLKQAEAIYTIMRRRKLNDEYFDRFNYEIYGGTPILGINGTVMIGHGISTPEAIKNMILLTGEIAEARLPEKITQAFQ